MELFFQRRSKPVPALELIEFQHDSTGRNLEASVTVIIEKIKDGTYKKPSDVTSSKDAEGIVNLLKKRFGMKFDLICDEFEAAIFPYQPNAHSIVTHPYNWGSSQLAMMMKKSEHLKTKGTVNTKDVFVTGVFAEYPSILYINFHALVNRYKHPAPEITAIILHEVGHAFTSCEYSDRMETNNQILADVFREITDRRDKMDMQYVYREVKRLDPDIEEAEIDALTSDNKIIAGYNWFKLFAGVIRSQMPNYLYDETSFEASADNFASRFGYGRELISALNRMEKQNGTYIGQYAHIWSYLRSLLTFYILVAGPILGVFFLPASTALVLGFYATLGLTAILADNTQTFWFKEYDETKERYIRIRNDTMNLLKSTSLPEKNALMVIETIKQMDIYIKETGVKKSVFAQIAKLLIPGESNATTEINVQRNLEALTSNDLFLKSAELKHA